MSAEVTNIRPERWLIQYEDIIEGNALRYFKSKNAVPSLHHLASIRVIASIWYEHFTNCKQTLSTSHLGKILINVANHIKTLQIPETTKQKLQPYIVMVGEQIYEWILLYDEQAFKKTKHVSMAKNYLYKITWTPEGTIDHIKTAKAMLTVNPKLYKRTVLICDLCKETVLLSAPLAFVENDDDDDVENSGYFSFRILKDLSSLEKKQVSLSCMFCFEREISEFLKTPSNLEYGTGVSALNCLLRVDFFCFLLSRCTGDFQEELFVRTDSGLMGFLFQLLAHPHWIDYCLPTLYHFRNDMNVKKLCTILRRLKLIIQCSFCWAIKGFSYMFEKCVFIFEEVWSFVPERLKINILESHPEVLTWLWTCNRLDSLSRYFSAYGCFDEHVKFAMFACHSFTIAFCRTISTEWRSFERYCLPVFFDDQSNELKDAFVASTAVEVVLICARLETWQNMEEFLKWCYKSPSKRRVETRKLLCKIFPKVCITRIVPEKRYKTRTSNREKVMQVDFALYDKLLMYYFKSERAVKVFKHGEFLKSGGLAKAFTHFLRENRFDLVEACVNWLFCQDVNKIKQFRNQYRQLKNQYRAGRLKLRDSQLPPTKRRRIE